MRRKSLVIALLAAIVGAAIHWTARIAVAFWDILHIPIACWRDPGFRSLVYENGLDIPPVTRYGFATRSSRVFTRNDWKVIELVTLPAVDGTVMVIWDAGMPYPLVSQTYNINTESTSWVFAVKAEVKKEFDKMFLPGRVWAGPAKFDQFVKHDRYLKRLGEQHGKQQLPNERQRTQGSGPGVLGRSRS